MFKLLRLFGRKDTIDDTAAAYIEGRATDRDQAELHDRAARSPGLIEDLDSIRATVSLLRSVEPVSAPRSFALAEAPVRVRVKRRSRMAMAPAVFAIAAAAAVGLLAVGNLADVVRQNDGSSSVQSSGSSNDSAAMITESATSETAADQSEDAARAGATPTPAAFGTTTPMLEGGDTGATSREPGIEVRPDGGAGEPEQALPPAVPDGDASTSAMTGPQTEPDDTGQEKQDGEDQPMPLPEATVTGFFEFSQSSQLEVTEPSNRGATAESDRSGFALPLWQLQVVFASIAVLMAGAWMLLQRRLTG